MVQVSSDILALTGEALVLAKAGSVCFANAAAKKLLGADCEGKRMASLFPPEIVGAQGSGFIADAPVNGERRIVRVMKQDGMQALFIAKPSGEPVMLSEALIYSMRNSLMTMCMSTELCRTRAEDIQDAELSAGLASMSQSYFRMSRILENLSAAKSIVSGTLRFTPARLHISDMCRQIVEHVNVFVPTPELSFEGGEDLLVEGDAALIELLLLNLISNSLIHAEGRTRVSVRLIDAGESVILSVTDNGCGIKSEELPLVFNKYVHSFPLAELGGGAGLGLTVVRGIAEKHGGTLLLESRPDMGTAVRVSLKKPGMASSYMSTPEEKYNTSSVSILTGLADYLPDKFYIERYLD